MVWNKQLDSANSEEKSGRVWYAIQTLHCKEERLGKYLTEKELNSFIPMRYEERISPDGKRKRILTPAVHNLLFLEKTFNENEVYSLIANSPVPFFPLRDRSTNKYYEIQDREIVELRAICDPNYKGTLFVDAAFAEARPGTLVCVIHGVFKGLEGKLVRYKNRYYVTVLLASMGVMVHIPKWYCQKIG